jgi:trans-2,3-dihydro-3-hydroxyanthranilate isomerase
MKIIDVHQVDAFTNELFGGNPAGVVTNAEGLSDTDMQHVAREMSLSETAFVLPPTNKQADVRLRYFTRSGNEVDFCGHATVGTLFQLAQLNLYQLGKPGNNTIGVETNAGTLRMAVANQDGNPHVSFTAPPVDMQAYRLQGATFAQACGIPSSALNADGTVLIDQKLNYVYIPTASLEQLSELTFDFTRIRDAFGQDGIVVFCFFTNETKQASNDLHARGLAPNVGIDEDPFTGSMQAGLVHAAKRNAYLSAAQQDVVIEQGHALGRPGFATVHHDPATDEMRITAQAAPVFSTRMEL